MTVHKMKEKKDEGQLALQFMYRRPTDIEMAKCEEIGAKLLETARFLKEKCPEGKELGKAYKALERVKEWAERAILQ